MSVRGGLRALHAAVRLRAEHAGELCAGHKDTLARLRSELDSVRAKQAGLKNGKAPQSAAAAGKAAEGPSSAANKATNSGADGSEKDGKAAGKGDEDTARDGDQEQAPIKDAEDKPGTTPGQPSGMGQRADDRTAHAQKASGISSAADEGDNEDEETVVE
jgi:hypothetical protein